MNTSWRKSLYQIDQRIHKRKTLYVLQSQRK